MSEPRISVVIPTFNHARFIGQCIECVIDQDYGSIEILVIDDGSTDSTKDVVAGFKDRVRYLHQENEGQASARASGIQNASGDLICLLDSDDYWSRGFLKSLVAKFSDSEVGIVFTNHDRVNAVGEVFEPDVFRNERTWLSTCVDPNSEDTWTTLDSAQARRLYFNNFPHTPSGALFRKSLVQHLPDKRLRRGDDYLFFMDYLVASRCAVAFSTEVLWHLRTHDSNIRQMNQSFSLLLKNDIFAKEELLRKHGSTLSESEKTILKKKIAVDYFDWAHGLSNHREFRQAAFKYLKSGLIARGDRISFQSILGLAKLPYKCLFRR